MEALRAASSQRLKPRLGAALRCATKSACADWGAVRVRASCERCGLMDVSEGVGDGEDVSVVAGCVRGCGVSGDGASDATQHSGV